MIDETKIIGRILEIKKEFTANESSEYYQPYKRLNFDGFNTQFLFGMIGNIYVGCDGAQHNHDAIGVNGDG